MILPFVASAAVMATSLLSSTAAAEFVLPELPPSPLFGECGRVAETVRQQISSGRGLESVPFEFVEKCYSVFRAGEEFKAEHVKELKLYFEIYPFTDLHRSAPGPPMTLQSRNIDVFEELDRIAANPNITSQYDFFSKIHELITSLHDANFEYAPICMTAFNMRQPFRLGAVYPTADGEPIIKILETSPASKVWDESLGTSDLETFLNYIVKSIDGVPAVQAIQSFADKYAAMPSPEARFNRVLLAKIYSEGGFITRPGLFSDMVFLPLDAAKPRTYVLTPPALADGTQPADVTVTVPWAAFPRRKIRNGIDSSNSGYYSAFCENRTLRPNDRLRRRQVSPAHKLVEGNGPLDVTPRTKTHANSLQRRQTTPNPVPVFSTFDSAVFVLDDGITGVFAFDPPTRFQFPDFLVRAASGLRALEQRGVQRLIIDVTANDGGYDCMLIAFAKYLLQNMTMIEDQFRLTPSVKALLKLGLFEIGTEYVVPSSGPGRDIIAAAYLQDRGAGLQLLSGRFRVCQGFNSFETGLKFVALPELERGWAPEDIAVVSDGGCRASCARMIRSMRDSHPGLKAFTYGGSSGKPFTPTSSEGGIGLTFFRERRFVPEDIWFPGELVNALNSEAFGLLTPEERAVIPSNMMAYIAGGVPVTQGYSPLGKGGLTIPVDWIPQPSDAHVVVTNPTACGTPSRKT
ncbi:hypothetical protein HDU96_009235 [Phlyctochytrium bullatum]|nr:hypothetical protein HDU96_009235 [Phlyctochytrium bullatum]